MRSTLITLIKYVSDKDTLITLAKGTGAITGMEAVDELAQVVPDTNIMIGQVPLKELLQIGMFVLTAIRLFKRPKKDKKPKKLYENEQ